MRKTASKGVQYGSINRYIFSQTAGNVGISKKMLKAVKSRKKLAAAGEFSIQLNFDPQCFLVNPIEDVRQYLTKFLGVNLSFAIRDRVVLDERGPDHKVMGPFFNTGGMWQGYDARGNEKTVRAQFFKSSFSSDFLLAELRKNTDLTMRQLKRAARERRKATESRKGYETNVRNRLKALSALNSKKKPGSARGREILEPTHEEHTAIMAYLEDLLQMRVMIGDVSNIRPKLRKARARRLVQALGTIKAPMIRVQ